MPVLSSKSKKYLSPVLILYPMKTLPFNIFQNIPIRSNQTFCSNSTNRPNTRCLELFNDIYQASKNRKIVKKVNIKDNSGNDNKSVIIKNSEPKDILLEDCSLYEMYTNGIKTGHIAFTNNADEYGRIYVYGIANEYNNSKNYKGIGTELLKLAVEHSMDKGFGGEIYLFADFVPEPTQFYYKSNLRISPKCSYVDHAKQEAILDYSVRNNINSSNFKNFPNAIPMSLDKNGAKAFLEGTRLYEKMESKTLYSTNIEGKNKSIKTDIDFCDFTDRENREYLLQIIEKKKHNDEISYEQIATMELKPALKECNNKEYIIDKIDIKDKKDEKLHQNIAAELYYALDILVEDMGINIINIA